MNGTDRVTLRIFGQGGIRLSEVRDCLADIEHVYNSIWSFDASIDRTSRTMSQLRRSGYGPWPSDLAWAFFVLPARRGRVPAAWPPQREEIASFVLPKDRLVLKAARLESPGFWEFLGKLNPLEVIRQYLVDQHERRKDREYREAAEARRLDLENRLLENRVLHERIAMARQLGATNEDLAPLLNEMLFRPLRLLERHQDQGVIEAGEIVGSHNEPPRRG